MSEHVVGIDIGTASSKAVVCRLDGTVVAMAALPHAMQLPRPGWAEMDADRVWWGDVAALCRLLAAQTELSLVGAVCVSGIGPCFLPCDSHGRPLRNGILYGIDTRATAEISELTDRYGAEELLRRGGTALSTQAVGPKMLWVRRNEPSVWARTARWHNASSYVVERVTGEYVLDHHTASQCDPLYDIHRNEWLPDVAEEIAPGLAMPRLLWPSEVAGTVTGPAAQETGLPPGTPVMAGTIDAWAESFSAGVRQPGDLMLMYGSTMFFVQVVDELRPDPLLWTTTGVLPGSLTLSGGMATSGSLTAWLRELVGGVPYEELVAAAAEVPAGSEGLVMLPYFAGERTPVFDPDARGVVAGLSLRHGRGHLFRAAYEGIAYGSRQILELLERTGGRPRRMIAVGGGTQGGLWTQIVSDVCGITQLLPEQAVGASYGDALLAAIGAGLVPVSTDWSRHTRSVEPDAGLKDGYDELYAVYRDLYPASMDVVHRLARRQQRSEGEPR